MARSDKWIDLPFQEAIDFFRKKIGMPTSSWADYVYELNQKAFVSAGAMMDDLLIDMQEAVERGLTDGIGIDEFRKDFSDITKRYGWSYKGSEGWRSALIFYTNMSSAYHYGHYQQMLDPDVVKARPYWRYVATSSREPRKDHLDWVGTILPADDGFWATHAPPNGWGCKCGIVSMSAREVEQWVKENSAIAKLSPPPIKYYTWKHPKTGKTYRIPEGIDPGWDYHPGLDPWRGQEMGLSMK